MEDCCMMLHLPVDMIDKILSHITDPASLARLASTCKFWRNIIKGRTFLDCLRRRSMTMVLPRPCSLASFTRTALSLLHHYCSITRASGAVWHQASCPCLNCHNQLAEKLDAMASHLLNFVLSFGVSVMSSTVMSPSQHKTASWPSAANTKGTNDQAQSDKFCVCNPLTGEIFHIPPNPVASPNMYTLHVTEDVNHGMLVSQSFRLMAIWIRQRRFMTGSYCSKAKRWVWFGETPELIPELYVVRSPAAASPGAIHFICGSSTNWTLTHITTLHLATYPKLSYLELPLDAKRSKAPLLANSADGSFLLLLLKGLQMSLWKHGSDTSSWILSETINLANSLPLRVVQMHARENIKLEMFLGKSGAVVLWVDGEGLFLFSLSDGLMRKIGKERATKKYSFCAYEIDWLSCLSIMNLVADDSLLLDSGRKTIQLRWRKTVARHMQKNKNHLDGKA